MSVSLAIEIQNAASELFAVSRTLRGHNEAGPRVGDQHCNCGTRCCCNCVLIGAMTDAIVCN
jgi:hypothetical protein